jgi:hypothetical protein
MTAAPPLTDEERAIVEANTGLIALVLRRRHTPTDEWADSYQDGVLGLCRAAQLFDPALGNRFSTYAYPWVWEAVSKGRGRLLGRSYRSGPRTWRAPLSIDHTLDHGDTIHDLFPDPGPGPDDEALAAEIVAEIAAHAERMDLDRIDRIIVGELLRPAGRRADRAVAERCEVTRECIRKRRLRLEAVLRDWAFGGAA